jgi:hypothetical protein
MRNPYEELDWAKNQIRKLDAIYIENWKTEAAFSAAGRKRKTENGKSWEELLKIMNVDVSRLLEHDKADSQRAAATIKALLPQLRTVPEVVVRRTYDELLLNELAGAKVDWDQPESHWLSYSLAYYRADTVEFNQSGDSHGTAEGDWGIVSPLDPYSNVMNPKSNAVGSGSGWQDENDVNMSCRLYYYISGEKIKRSGKVYVWPYFDIHGCCYIRANDGYFSSKNAVIRLKVTTNIFRPNRTYAESFMGVIFDRNNDNIDEAGRIDFVGWNNSTKAESLVDIAEPLTVRVTVQLLNYASGGGSHALMDFQTGEGNKVRVPNIAVWVP